MFEQHRFFSFLSDYLISIGNTSIVKKKLDEKNYVALTGLRSKCPLGKFKTKMTTHYVSAWFRRFYGKIGHC